MAHSVISKCLANILELQIYRAGIGLAVMQPVQGTHVIFVNPGEELEVKVNNIGLKNLPIHVTWGPEWLGSRDGIVIKSKSFFNTNHVWTPAAGLVPFVVTKVDLYRASVYPLSDVPGNYGVIAVKIKGDGPWLTVNVRDVRYVPPRAQ